MKDSLQSLPDVPEVGDLAKLQAQMLRPAQNVNMDGSFELGWGTALLCFGSVSYLNAVLPESVWTSWWTAWIGYLPLICAGFAPYAIPRMIKRFITWPRTGYVANPNDLKLIQLVMLMVFGGALGFSLSLPFVLVSEIREAISQAGAHSDLHSIILHGIELLVCATLAVYLGRKTIRKRQPLPAAYDAALINQGLGQTSAGRKTLRVVKFTLLLMFVGIPILVCGVVFGLMYLEQVGNAPYRDPLAPIGRVELPGGDKCDSLLDGQWRRYQATPVEVAGAGDHANRADRGCSRNSLSRRQT